MEIRIVPLPLNLFLLEKFSKFAEVLQRRPISRISRRSSSTNHDSAFESTVITSIIVLSPVLRFRPPRELLQIWRISRAHGKLENFSVSFFLQPRLPNHQCLRHHTPENSHPHPGMSHPSTEPYYNDDSDYSTPRRKSTD